MKNILLSNLALRYLSVCNYIHFDVLYLYSSGVKYNHVEFGNANHQLALIHLLNYTLQYTPHYSIHHATVYTMLQCSPHYTTLPRLSLSLLWLLRWYNRLAVKSLLSSLSLFARLLAAKMTSKLCFTIPVPQFCSYEELVSQHRYAYLPLMVDVKMLSSCNYWSFHIVSILLIIINLWLPH